MMSFQPAKNKRIKGTSISIPIIYGSKAIPLKLAATEAEDGDDVDTHSWTVYMRPVDGRDLTWLISKVEFHLHESFKTPRRIRTEAPYEESEKGWGEFTIPIKIYFVQDSKEKPLTINHKLKLFYDKGDEKNEASLASKKRTGEVVSEFYDEIVLRNPSQKIYEAYKSRYSVLAETLGQSQPLSTADGLLGTQFSSELSKSELSTINTALKKVQHQLAIYKTRHKQTQTELERRKIMAGIKPVTPSPALISFGQQINVGPGVGKGRNQPPPTLLPTPLNILPMAGMPSMSPLAASASSIASVHSSIISASSIAESSASAGTISQTRSPVAVGAIRPIQPAPRIKASPKSPKSSSALSATPEKNPSIFSTKSPELAIETAAAANGTPSRKRRAK